MAWRTQPRLLHTGTQQLGATAIGRRRPEDSVLYKTIATHWPAFSERMEEHGGLPSFVRDEFEAYLQCGRLECGFLELECRQCGHSQLVALSCKKRGWWPSCLGGRISDGAVHLEQCVLPRCLFVTGSAAPSTASELDPRLQRVLRACPPQRRFAFMN